MADSNTSSMWNNRTRGPFNSRKSWIFRIATTLALFVLLIIQAGCSKPNPHPEMIDPIYNDLVARSAEAKTAAETKREEIIGIKKELDSLPARDPSRKKTLENLRRSERQLMVAEQNALYYEVRAEQRKAFAYDQYMEAYQKGKPWPDPAEFLAYKNQKKLESGPREWGSRIPKSDRYNKKTPDQQRKALEDKIKSQTTKPAH